VKNRGILLRLVVYSFALSFAGCAGFFRQATTPTTAYKPVHQHALGGEVPGLEDSLRKDPTALNLGDANGNSPLILAAFHGHVDAVQFLLQRGAIVDKTNNQHQTALILAAKAGHRKIVELLLRSGADANIRDARGWNAQMWAERQGYPEIARTIQSNRH
jgi:ankyrin repeat protein